MQRLEYASLIFLNYLNLSTLAHFKCSFELKLNPLPPEIPEKFLFSAKKFRHEKFNAKYNAK